jgi:hypothetical protein
MARGSYDDVGSRKPKGELADKGDKMNTAHTPGQRSRAGKKGGAAACSIRMRCLTHDFTTPPAFYHERNDRIVMQPSVAVKSAE